MLYFHNQNGHFQASIHSEHSGHESVEIPIGQKAPQVKGTIKKDYSGSWLLHIETLNFQFAPEKAGMDDINYSEGHAHLSINGEKINRLYGNYYNLGELEEGSHRIKVTLNANNHGVFTFAGKEIAFSKTLDVK